MSTTLKPRTTTVVIYQGDDMEQMVDLRRAAEQAIEAAKPVPGAPKRLGDEPDDSDAVAAQEAYNAFVDEAAERALTVRLQSIGRKRFRDLLAAHPPRKVTVKVAGPADEDGNPGPQVEEERDHEDDWLGVNSETFSVALLTYVDADDTTVRTIVEPDFTGRKAIEDFLDNEVPDGDFDKLWIAAYTLNKTQSIDPKDIARYSSAPRSSTGI